jgi:hypothetical protein
MPSGENYMTVYIVVRHRQCDLVISAIESTWTTRELAESAIKFHAANAMLPPSSYYVIRQEVNRAQYRMQD